MKRLLTACAVTLGLLASQAGAQSIKDGNWAGFYGGAYLGYDVGKAEMLFKRRIGLPDANLSGFAGGAVLGYNFQRGQIVYGLEADYGFSNLGGTSERPDRFCRGNCDVQTSSIGSLRARVGFAKGRFLPYVTGGVAVAKADVLPLSGRFSLGEETTVGYTLGLGSEYALTDRVSLKAEALYMSFGKTDYRDGFIQSKVDSFSLRLGANFHF